MSVTYMARHGQTRSNIERRYAGASSESLTATGRSQAAQLASQFSRVAIREVWSSVIVRALETAEIIARALKVPLKPDGRLNEMQLGPWEGMTEAEVAAVHPEEYQLWLSCPDRLMLRGRETLEALARRVSAAVQDAQRCARPVILVSHVAPIRVAALAALGLPLSRYKEVRVENVDCLVLGDRSGARRLEENGSLGIELERHTLIRQAG